MSISWVGAIRHALLSRYLAYPIQSVLGDAINIMVWPNAALPAAISIGACSVADEHDHRIAAHVCRISDQHIDSCFLGQSS
jgi:hypothetical protein